MKRPLSLHKVPISPPHHMFPLMFATPSEHPLPLIAGWSDSAACSGLSRRLHSVTISKGTKDGDLVLSGRVALLNPNRFAPPTTPTLVFYYFLLCL